MEKVQGVITLMLILTAVGFVAAGGPSLLRRVYYRALIAALQDILDFTKYRAACEIRDAYIMGKLGRSYSLDEFLYVLDSFEANRLAVARPSMGCQCGSCTKEYALSFNIRRRKRPKEKRRSAWLEAGEVVPIRA